MDSNDLAKLILLKAPARIVFEIGAGKFLWYIHGLEKVISVALLRRGIIRL